MAWVTTMVGGRMLIKHSGLFFEKSVVSEREKMTCAGGLGPWFCTLLFNTSDECKKQTHLLAHTMPHLACDMLNRADSDDCWVILIKVGPFQVWDDCVAYLNLWTSRTRGRIRRLERGVEIFKHFAPQLGLTFWYQNETKETILAQHRATKKKNAPPAAAAVAAASKRPLDRIDMQEAEAIFCNGVPATNLTVGMIQSVQLKRIKYK